MNRDDIEKLKKLADLANRGSVNPRDMVRFLDDGPALAEEAAEALEEALDRIEELERDLEKAISDTA